MRQYTYRLNFTSQFSKNNLTTRKIFFQLKAIDFFPATRISPNRNRVLLEATQISVLKVFQFRKLETNKERRYKKRNEFKLCQHNLSALTNQDIQKV